MPTVGEFNDPFPFPPYAPQHDAVTRIRRALQQQQQQQPQQCGVVVLESPTGTGKSHVLLASALSHLFRPVYPSAGASSTHPRAKLSPGAKNEEEGAILPLNENSHINTHAGPRHTLQEALQQRQLEEEVEQLKAERKERVRALRRRLRAAQRQKERMMIAARAASTPGGGGGRYRGGEKRGRSDGDDKSNEHDDDTEFLLDQNPVDFLLDTTLGSRAAFTSSSTASDSSSRGCDSETEEGIGEEGYSNGKDQEALLMRDLAARVPLRKPKAFIASRTHTQISQLFQDLLDTDFVAFPIVSRHTQRAKPQSLLSETASTANQPATEKEVEGQVRSQSSRLLHAVHIGGRQQLCINASIQRAARGRVETHNDLCREAMQWEHSKAGRAARREEIRQKAAGVHVTPSNTVGRGVGGREDTPTSPNGKERGIADLEDLASLGSSTNKGCAYCATSRLDGFLQYLEDTEKDSTTDAQRPLSMEAMKALGRTLGACPYLASRLLVRGADVVFAPYGYLASEDLRNHLLGGIATNPVMDSEVELIRQCASPSPAALADSCPQQQSLSTSASLQVPSLSLSAMLYERRQRAAASYAACSAAATSTASLSSEAAASAIRDRKRAAGRSVITDNTNAHDRVHRTAAALALESIQQGPNFTGDVIVFDEAHNLVDYCRSVSTASMTTRELMLVRSLLGLYVSRYESQLLSKNKQRLREMVLFSDKVIAYCLRRIQPQQQHSKQTVEETTSSVVENFSSFLFGAGVDHVDVFPFLVFLLDSRLGVKLQGLVPFVLKQESEQRQRLREQVSDQARRSQLDRARKQHRAGQTPDTKVARMGHPHLDHASEQMERIEGAGGTSRRDEGVFTDLFTSLLSQDPKSGRNSTPESSHSIDRATKHAREPVCVDVAARLTARAVQKFDALLRACYVSGWGDVTTRNGCRVDGTARVILEQHRGSDDGTGTAKGDFNDSDASRANGNAEAHSKEDVVVTLRIIQLEPGRHTLGPVLQQAKGVILAGGTMQPLALSCALLLPPTHPLPRVPAPTPASASSSMVEINLYRSEVKGESHDRANQSHSPITLISEPHVVPPTSITVWAPPCGPSGRPLLFRHSDLTGAGPIGTNTLTTLTASSTATAASSRALSPEAATFTELAMALLNFARVLPPAGVICFFTSYALETRFTDFLVTNGLYDGINDVKRIFRETSGSVSATVDGGDGTKDEASVEEMLAEYKRWIEGDTAVINSANAKTEGSRLSSGTATAGASFSHEKSVPPQQQRTPSITRQRRGALLFAVMGGKLSEGINFADDLSRAVLVIGLPYANLADPELRLFLEHVATTRLSLTHSSPSSSYNNCGMATTTAGAVAGTSTRSATQPPSLALTASRSVELTDSSSRESAIAGSGAAALSREEWSLYTDMCMRTVNQCIGRCIRHAGDYAAVILVDARYAQRADLRWRVSAWMHPSMRVAVNFGECFRGIREFFLEKSRGR